MPKRTAFSKPADFSSTSRALHGTRTSLLLIEGSRRMQLTLSRMIHEVNRDSFSFALKRLRRMLALPPCSHFSKSPLALAKNKSKLHSFCETQSHSSFRSRTSDEGASSGAELPSVAPVAVDPRHPSGVRDRDCFGSVT
eukprot:3223386-Pleurochrysis_carterae.AAC.1